MYVHTVCPAVITEICLVDLYSSVSLHLKHILPKLRIYIANTEYHLEKTCQRMTHFVAGLKL